MKLASVAKVFLCLALLVGSVPALRAQAPAETATQFYTKYLAASGKATKIEQLLPMMGGDTKKQIEATPVAQRAQMFEMFKMMSSMNTGIKVVKETATPKGATLNLEGLGPDKKKVTGVATIVKEAGAWKFAGEEWKN